MCVQVIILSIKRLPPQVHIPPVPLYLYSPITVMYTFFYLYSAILNYIISLVHQHHVSYNWKVSLQLNNSDDLFNMVTSEQEKKQLSVAERVCE